jgi:hypothetical protein
MVAKLTNMLFIIHRKAYKKVLSFPSLLPFQCKVLFALQRENLWPQRYEAWSKSINIKSVKTKTVYLQGWRLIHINADPFIVYTDISKSSQSHHQDQERQVVQTATRFCSIAIFWVSLASCATITLCIASQMAFIVLHVKCNPGFSNG